MSSDRPSSSIDRRVLISGMALLPALSGMRLVGIAQAQTTQGGSLASWNDGPAKQAIMDFVRAATEQDGIDRALAECSRQDSGCRVIAIGPFAVEPQSPGAPQ